MDISLSKTELAMIIDALLNAERHFDVTYAKVLADELSELIAKSEKL